MGARGAPLKSHHFVGMESGLLRTMFCEWINVATAVLGRRQHSSKLLFLLLLAIDLAHFRHPETSAPPTKVRWLSLVGLQLSLLRWLQHDAVHASGHPKSLQVARVSQADHVCGFWALGLSWSTATYATLPQQNWHFSTE